MGTVLGIQSERNVKEAPIEALLRFSAVNKLSKVPRMLHDVPRGAQGSGPPLAIKDLSIGALLSDRLSSCSP